MSDNKEPILVEQVPQQWEYMSSSLSHGMEDLKKLGEQGWEVVDGVKMACGREVVFKRLKPKQPTQKKESSYGYSR